MPPTDAGGTRDTNVILCSSINMPADGTSAATRERDFGTSPFFGSSRRHMGGRTLVARAASPRDYKIFARFGQELNWSGCPLVARLRHASG